MKTDLINEKVYVDYRDNILTDKDNPVLAFKANRDRFFHKSYSGLPQLGSINSEDAITWNLIRTLCLTGDYSPLESLIGLKLINPKILLWTLSFDVLSNELQYVVGSLIRSIDGKYHGQIIEPDIIIESQDHLFVFECKLGEKNKYPGHLWDSHKGSKGPEVRQTDYFSGSLFNQEALNYNGSAYQLYRMAFYAYKIAERLNKKPVLVSLVNKSWWKIGGNKLSPSDLWNSFVSQVTNQEIKLMNVFWQDIKVSSSNMLSGYLMNHKCL